MNDQSVWRAGATESSSFTGAIDLETGFVAEALRDV